MASVYQIPQAPHTPGHDGSQATDCSWWRLGVLRSSRDRRHVRLIRPTYVSCKPKLAGESGTVHPRSAHAWRRVLECGLQRREKRRHPGVKLDMRARSDSPLWVAVAATELGVNNGYFYSVPRALKVERWLSLFAVIENVTRSIPSCEQLLRLCQLANPSTDADVARTEVPKMREALTVHDDQQLAVDMRIG